MSWVSKYHPQCFDEMVGSDELLYELNNIVLCPNEMPHLILHGPPGTGKTTSVDCIIKQIHGSTVNPRDNEWVLMLNAGQHRHLHQFDRLLNFSKCLPRTETIGIDSNGFIVTTEIPRLIILDESDSMTEEVQYSMRQLIEDVSDHCRFIFICNHLEKMVTPIQSRCSIISFSPLQYKWCSVRLLYICNNEQVRLSYNNPELCDTILERMLWLSHNDIRKTINMLQMLHSLTRHQSRTITMEDIEKVHSMNVLNEDDIHHYIELIQSGAIRDAVCFIYGKGYMISCICEHIQKWYLVNSANTINISTSTKLNKIFMETMIKASAWYIRKKVLLYDLSLKIEMLLYKH
jgi:DNA polymerase III delta prime subunit